LAYFFLTFFRLHQKQNFLELRCHRLPLQKNIRPGDRVDRWEDYLLEGDNPMTEFHVGEKVVHQNFGLGEILKMDVQFIHDREMLCYVVKTKDLSIWVRADDPAMESLREPTPKSDFGGLFDILQSQGEVLPPDWIDRKAHLSLRMKDGRLASICSVIRDLCCYRQIKRLNEYDKFTLERAESLLLTEWVYSLSIPYLQAKRQLMQFFAG
jgi:RNA polymerase-interacting CarD/CdnL/TRCF family regulator